MKIVQFNTKSEAEAEALRLITALGLPEGMTYGEPFEYKSSWALKVKENGTWPATSVIRGVIEEMEEPDLDNL